MSVENLAASKINEDSSLELRAASVVETIGPCTQDQDDCEVMQAAKNNKNAAPDEKLAQSIRIKLAEVACNDCIACYLSGVDIVTNDQ